MNKNDMVLVPRERLEQWQKTALEWKIDSIGTGIMSVLAEQHQGEPVAFCWSYKMGGEQRFFPRDPRTEQWGVDMSEYITDVEPLYTRPAPADTGEVERLRAELESERGLRRKLAARFGQYKDEAKGEADTVRAQLAERVALLKRCEVAVGSYDGALYEELRALSASAEHQQNQTKE